MPLIARRQGGVFTAAQARAEGWTERTVRRRISSQRWVYVAGRALAEPNGPRALAAPTGRWTAFQLAMGAHLTLPNAVISHRTAAELHGFPAAERPAETCEVILSVHRRAGRAIQVHLMHLADADVHVGRAGLRLTSPARTALDCLATMPFGAALDLWAWVSTRGILDRAALASAVLARRNWYGTPQLRRLGDLTASGAISQAEFCFHELLRRAALTGWTANVSIVDGDGLIGLADIAFLTQRVIIEIDGFRSHSSQSAFIADRRRQNRLVMAGYTVLRFTWSDLLNNPDDVITHVRRALAASARRF